MDNWVGLYVVTPTDDWLRMAVFMGLLLGPCVNYLDNSSIPADGLDVLYAMVMVIVY